jgi:hypothetical protein
MTGYIEFSGLTMNNCRLEEYSLPGRQITDTLIYHMFASGLFDTVRVKLAYESTYQEYNRAQMQNYVQERDRLEIRKLRAEIAEMKLAPKM